MDFRLLQDTICAIATPVGEAGIGLIRLSGPEAHSMARKIFIPKNPDLNPRSHTLHYGWIKEPRFRRTGRRGAAQLHGSAQNLYPRRRRRNKLPQRIRCAKPYPGTGSRQPGARLAQPGEFTRRAFLNGRIDLSQAEAVIEIIRSRSEQGLLLANRHLRGDFREAHRKMARDTDPGPNTI